MFLGSGCFGVSQFLAGSCPGTTGRPEVPGAAAVLPALRVFANDRWCADSCRAVVPPFGPVLPALRESAPQRPDFWATYLNMPSSPTVLRILVNLLLSLSSIVAHPSELDSSPSLQ